MTDQEQISNLKIEIEYLRDEIRHLIYFLDSQSYKKNARRLAMIQVMREGLDKASFAAYGHDFMEHPSQPFNRLVAEYAGLRRVRGGSVELMRLKKEYDALLNDLKKLQDYEKDVILEAFLSVTLEEYNMYHEELESLPKEKLYELAEKYGYLFDYRQGHGISKDELLLGFVYCIIESDHYAPKNPAKAKKYIDRRVDNYYEDLIPEYNELDQ
jgi:hypothetical protein